MDPDNTADAFICPLCGDLWDFDGTEVLRRHGWAGGEYSFWVCPGCAERKLCPANLHGIHGEILDASDPYFRPELWPGVLIDAGAPYQLGQCVRCWAPMRWNVEHQRWEDLVLAGGYKTLFHGLSSMQNHLRKLSQE